MQLSYRCEEKQLIYSMLTAIFLPQALKSEGHQARETLQEPANYTAIVL